MAIDSHRVSEDLYILSLGCGCGLDYYGLILARNDYDKGLDMHYTGVDVIDWPYKDCMEDFEFIQVDLGAWNQFDRDSYDVIIFPKSIGELSDRDFNNLLGTFSRSQFRKDRIFLAASIRSERKEIDSERLSEIKKVFLTQHGYSSDSDLTYNCDSDIGIATAFPQFKYPDHILEYVINLQEQCAAKDDNCYLYCSIGRWPILKLKYLLYRIIALVR